MSPRTVPESCHEHACDRRFGGADTERRHRVGGRCLSDSQLRSRDIVKASDGIYRRSMQTHLAGLTPTAYARPVLSETDAEGVGVGEDA